jgi:hypothetical protein
MAARNESKRMHGTSAVLDPEAIRTYQSKRLDRPALPRGWLRSSVCRWLWRLMAANSIFCRVLPMALKPQAD